MKRTNCSQASKSGSYISNNRLCEKYDINSQRCLLVEGARCVHDGDQERCSFYEQMQRKFIPKCEDDLISHIGFTK